MVFPLYRTIP